MDDSEVEYDVSGWPQERLERLLGTLARAGITFEVERGNLVVHKLHEPRVDSLITAIEGEAPIYDASAFGSPLPPPPPPGFAAYPPPPGGLHPGGAWPGYPVVRPKTSGYAIASLVLGLVWICGLGSLLAVIFGGVALSQIKKSEGRTTGTGLAIAGLVLGILGLLLVAASLIWGEDTTSAPLR